MSISKMQSLNRSNLNKLSVGLSKTDALAIMGIKTYNINGDIINNPYKTEIKKGENGKSNLEIVFYYTDTKKVDGAITDDELTPLVFIEGKLEGWGWTFFDDNVKKYQIRTL